MKFTSSIIKDADLAEYLKDKLTTKPDYGFETELDSTDMINRWRAAQEAEAEIRKNNNKSAGRGLKK